MRNIVVIGASSGIGKELASHFLREGDTVFLLARRTEILNELHLEFPEHSYFQYFDVTENDGLFEKLTSIFHQMITVDLVVNCAGTGDINPDLKIGIEKNTIDTNVTGFTVLTDACFNFFKSQGFGHLVVISSIAGLRGGAAAPAYNASKAFQISYLEALQIKVGKENLPICITDVRPGFVDTAMAKGGGLFFVASVEKAARQIVKAIQKRKRVVYVTKRWRFIAWIMRNLPFPIYSRL